MALKVRRLYRHNGSLHAHVLIRRGFGLCAEADSAHPLQQLPLSRSPIGREPDLASWLVQIPNRDRERSASLFGNADDSHVKVGEKALAFLLRHCRRHCSLPPAPRSAARSYFTVSQIFRPRWSSMGSLDHLVRSKQDCLRDRQAQHEGRALGHQDSYCGGVIRPTTTAPGSTLGVGLSTTVSAWAGMIPIRGWMVNP